jgi:hypothetical protein
MRNVALEQRPVNFSEASPTGLAEAGYSTIVGVIDLEFGKLFGEVF